MKSQHCVLELQGERAHTAILSPTKGSAAFKLQRADRVGQSSAKQLDRDLYSCICGERGNQLNNDGGGKDPNQVTTMLVDTGSAVTVVGADLWESITGGHPIELKSPEQPVVVADGKPLEQLGQVSVFIHVGGVCVCTQQNVLVVQELTQECLLGQIF